MAFSAGGCPSSSFNNWRSVQTQIPPEAAPHIFWAARSESPRCEGFAVEEAHAEVLRIPYPPRVVARDPGLAVPGNTQVHFDCPGLCVADAVNLPSA